jgi:diguanylate cyclase (GGDEF)-like protein
MALAISPSARIGVRVVVAAGLIGLGFHLAHASLNVGGHGLDVFNNDVVYNVLISGAALMCLLRAAVFREDRRAWGFIAVGLTSWAIGEIYYSLAFGDSGNVPTPSLADVFYLLFYPACYAGLLALMRKRFVADRRVWLDGAIAALASAAVAAALVFEPIAATAHGELPKVLTNVAYPIGDLLLLMLVVFMFARSGWRPGRAWLLLGVGMILSAVADSSYLYLTAVNSYTVGTPLDSLWPASMLMFAFAAWRPVAAPGPARASDELRLLVAPALFALVALGVLLYGNVADVGALGVALAAVTLALVIVRAATTFRDNLRMLEASRREALTDALTGLGNRRRLIEDLEHELLAPIASTGTLLAMFDLDGFKIYNDRFGHMAGDTLLSRLAHKLDAAVSSCGSAYRLGGDEFCVLVRVDRAAPDAIVEAAREALSDSGEGFDVSCSCGSVQIPDEAETAMLALRLADDRMYAHKDGRRASARHQARSVLLGLMREREPELHRHLYDVGRQARAVGQRLGMTAEQLDELTRAAELHDIGKAAIPDAILNKPGALDADEWLFMRRHTIIGERILAEAPALVPVAALVRASHERWDGAGYPDGLTGDQIPLGARVIMVCDAFHAMTNRRAYSEALSPEVALDELRRGGGTQFDPLVVDAFCAEWISGAFVSPSDAADAGALPSSSVR